MSVREEAPQNLTFRQINNYRFFFRRFFYSKLNRKNSSELAQGLPPEEEFEKPWVSQVQDSSKIPRSSAAVSFISTKRQEISQGLQWTISLA